MKKFLKVFCIMGIVALLGITVIYGILANYHHDYFENSFGIEARSFSKEEAQLLQPWVIYQLKQLERECDSAMQTKDVLFKNNHPDSSEEANNKLARLYLYNDEILKKCGTYRKASTAARYFTFNDLSVEKEGHDKK